uniref:Ig-like domain-containing protein n=1 Tax=Pygocentrus nattereri TaxID=42514 RepID=A0A3B4DRS3_PYGNA
MCQNLKKVYVLNISVLFFTGETADIIKQNQTSMLLSEGSNATLSCTYDGYVNSLHWYQQKPGSRPEFLLLIMESNRHITKVQNKRVDLLISSAKSSDSALNYCALEPTVTRNPATL